MTAEQTAINLVEQASASPVPQETRDDRRQRMPEPLPVRLVTVEDAHLVGIAGLERELDDFYVGLLGFERESPESVPCYRADNFRIFFDLVEVPKSRDDMRPLGIEVPSLELAEKKLIEASIEYLRQKGLNPGQECLLLRDPSGNWIELTASAEIF